MELEFGSKFKLIWVQNWGNLGPKLRSFGSKIELSVGIPAGFVLSRHQQATCDQLVWAWLISSQITSCNYLSHPWLTLIKCDHQRYNVKNMTWPGWSNMCDETSGQVTHWSDVIKLSRSDQLCESQDWSTAQMTSSIIGRILPDHTHRMETRIDFTSSCMHTLPPSAPFLFCSSGNLRIWWLSRLKWHTASTDSPWHTNFVVLQQKL